MLNVYINIGIDTGIVVCIIYLFLVNQIYKHAHKYTFMGCMVARHVPITKIKIQA